MLIGLCSIKGSPGVTTTGVAMTARWPEGDPVLVETDPAGGDLACRFRLAAKPGLVSLAAAARRDSSADLLAEHSQRLPGGLRVVPGPVGAEQSRAALGVLTTRGLRTLRAAARESAVVVDVGRLDAASPALPLVRGTEALVVLAQPRAEELSHVATLLEAVATWTPSPGLVLVGDGYPRGEVERELGVPVLASLPHDPTGAAVLCGQARGRSPDRSGLGKAAARLARTVRDHVHGHGNGTTDPAEALAVTNGEVSR